MIHYLKPKVAVMLLMFALLPGLVTQAYAGNHNSKGQQGGPPPEAIKACEGKEDGDTTSFKGRRGEELEGICKEIEGQLAAVPENRPDKE